MIEVSNIALPLDSKRPGGQGLICQAACEACNVGGADLEKVVVLKRSVDARKKSDVHFVVTLGISLTSTEAEEEVLRSAAARKVQARWHVPYEPLAIPKLSRLSRRPGGRPVVVGTGPAGLFCALYLARAGLRPIVLERGGSIEDRLRQVIDFERGGAFNASNNIQFGEGGAGTFSDGKLTTNIKSPYAPHVLRWFVQAGAPRDILVEAKAHIGTDRLVGTVRDMREQVRHFGGEVRFDTQLTGFEVEDGALRAVQATDVKTGATERIETRYAVLACGHSARDTFALLRDEGFELEQKPFSVGVRIEHSQDAINRAQYGEAAGHPMLGSADYKLATKVSGGRGVYTFCMCPGGEVVCASSEEGGVAVNGMSNHARAGSNANSAVLVGVEPADFGSSDVLAGVELQRRMERAAYDAAVRAGGMPYEAPVQTVGDFLAAGEAGAAGQPQPSAAATVEPSYKRGVVWCNVRECLPGFVGDALAEALPVFDRKLHGFADAGAVMTGVETRSSSPVRIVRDGTLQASGITGVYPCGEGAGYAGGIMSAACDGLRVAEAVAARVQERS